MLSPVKKFAYIESQPMFSSAQQSPAVAVPENWNAQCTCGHRWYAVMPTENCPSCNPSPRITEQKAREIVEGYLKFNSERAFTDTGIDSWLDHEGRALLDKLNGDQNEKAN